MLKKKYFYRYIPTVINIQKKGKTYYRISSSYDKIHKVFSVKKMLFFCYSPTSLNFDYQLVIENSFVWGKELFLTKKFPQELPRTVTP